MYGVLKRLEASEKSGNLRTKEVRGFFKALPEPKSSFLMTSESLTEGNNVRILRTSEVQSVTSALEGTFFRIQFKTLNSTYELTVDALEVEEHLIGGRDGRHS